MHVFKINRFKLVGGLAWRETGEEALRTNTKRLAEANKTKFGAVTQALDSPTMVGLVPASAGGAHKGSFSAALWLAGRNEKALFVEALKDGQFWIVGTTRAGGIAPGTDIILPSDEASDYLDQLVSFNDEDDTYEHIYTVGTPPMSAMLERITDGLTPLESINEALVEVPIPADAKIKQLRGIRPETVIATLLVLVSIGLGYGGWQYKLKKEEERELQAQIEAARAAELAAAEIATLTELRIAEAVDAKLQVDTSTPVPSDVVNKCLDITRRIGFSVAGWVVDSLECAADGSSAQISLSINRKLYPNATNEMLMTWAAKQIGSLPQIDAQKQTALVSIPLDRPPTRQPIKLKDLPGHTDITWSLGSRLQMGVAAMPDRFKGTMHQATSREITYLDPQKESNTTDPTRFVQVPADRGYLQGKVSIQGESLWSADQVSFDYPFFTIESMTLQPVGLSDFRWSLSGNFILGNKA